MDAAPARLWAARALAWSMLFGAWTVLGALAEQSARSGGVPGLALAAWLAAIGALLVAGAGRRTSMTALAGGLAAGAVLAAGGLAAAPVAPTAGPLAAALGWALLLVTASRVVQALRAVQPRRAAAPIGPAFAGAAIAWLAAPDPARAVADTAAIGFALLAAAALLAALRPRAAAPVPGCRAGLFDCSLPLPRGAAWRRVADWPLHAASLAMLPTMAALPRMAELCAGDGLGAAAVTGLHLAAMVVPAALLRGSLGRWPAPVLRGTVGTLLAAGGVALAVGDGGTALLAGMLLHACAWSLAWAAPMLARDVAADASGASPQPSPAPAALAAACAVLALAAGAGHAGPDALLRAAHVALALLAVAGLALPRLRAGARLVHTDRIR